MSVFIVALFPVSMMLRLLPLVILFWIVCPAYVCVGIHMRVLKPLFPELFDFEVTVYFKNQKQQKYKQK